MMSSVTQDTFVKEANFEQQGNLEHFRTVWFIILASQEWVD